MNGGIDITSEVKQDGRMALGKQISDIQEARKNVANQNSILSADIGNYGRDADNTFYKLQDTLDKVTKSFDSLSKAINSDLKSTDEKTKLNALSNKELVESIKLNKQLTEQQKKLDAAHRLYLKAQKDGTLSSEDAFKLKKAMEELSVTVPGVANVFKETQKNYVGSATHTIRELENAVEDFKDKAVEAGNAIDKKKEQYDRDVKTGGQDIKKAFKEEISKLGDSISQLMNTLNINRLASQLAPSSKQLLQGNLQTTYNLSADEFDQFKKELYDQMAGTKYSNDDILQAMEALNTTALGSTKTATAYFKDLVRGQKLLGLSAQTQQELLKLGNITGRNELVFYQNQVAKYLNSSLGLNKQQLEELINLNATLQTQAADLGIATEAFENMSMNESAAFEATNTGFGSKYTQAISSLLANTDTAAALLGMDSGELSARLARGESFIDILRNGHGAREALNVLSNGSTEDQTRYFEHASSAWGIDRNMWSVLRLIAQQGEELNKNLSTATDAATQDGQEAIKTIEEQQFESINVIQSTVQDILKWFNQNVPWQILQVLSSIGVMLTTLISVVKITSSLKELSGLGGGGGSSLLSTLGGKFFTGAGGSKALTGLGSFTAGVAGFGLMAKDAIQTANYSDNQAVGALRGALMGTAYKGQDAGSQAVSILGNGAKGALIGGAFGGVPGALIGGGIGLILGGIGSLFDKKESEEEKRAKAQEEYLEAIKESTRATAINTAANRASIGMVYRYRGYSNYSSMGGPMGGPAGGSYNVTSNYGYRNSFQTDNGNWTGTFHSGTDFGAPEGTPLYSNATGTVAAVGKDSAGANYVGVTDSKGYTHWYWHLQKAASVVKGQKVQQGQLVGYVGHTGNAKGDHLHYMVTKPNRYDWWNAQDSTINPLPFATSSIFEGGANTSGTDSIIDNNNYAKTIGVSKLHANNIGSIATPIVNSIGDLKNTIIKLSEQTSRNQKIMDALVNRTMESPTV